MKCETCRKEKETQSIKGKEMCYLCYMETKQEELIVVHPDMYDDMKKFVGEGPNDVSKILDFAVGALGEWKQNR